MRAAAIFGPNASERDLQAFEEACGATWHIDLPQNSDNADAILIFGGDGTIHRYLPELIRLQLPVLVVPCGSGNDFARALGLRNKRASLAAWKKYVAGDNNFRRIDIGVIVSQRLRPTQSEALTGTAEVMLLPQCDEHYFCCVGGVGLDAEVARRANNLPAWLRAHGGYAMSLLPTLLQFTPVAMRISFGDDSAEFKPAMLAAFANAPTYGGGMKIAPKARLDDGMLDVCIVREISSLKLLRLFPTIYFGKHLQVREVDYQQTPSVKIETEHAFDVYADGEYVCKTPIEVSVIRAALPVIVRSSQTSFQKQETRN